MSLWNTLQSTCVLFFKGLRNAHTLQETTSAVQTISHIWAFVNFSEVDRTSLFLLPVGITLVLQVYI